MPTTDGDEAEPGIDVVQVLDCVLPPPPVNGRHLRDVFRPIEVGPGRHPGVLAHGRTHTPNEVPPVASKRWLPGPDRLLALAEGGGKVMTIDLDSSTLTHESREPSEGAPDLGHRIARSHCRLAPMREQMIHHRDQQPASKQRRQPQLHANLLG
jgi:hypothetical protein